MDIDVAEVDVCTGLCRLIDLVLHFGVKAARDDFRGRLGESAFHDLGLVLVRDVNDARGEVVD